MIPTIYNELTSYIHTFASDLAGGEPMAKGLITVGILGSLVAILRNVPRKIYNMILSRFSVTLQFSNNWEGENREMFRVAGKFVSKYQYRKQYKILQTYVNYKRRSITNNFSVSSSAGIFFYGWKPVYYLLEEAKEQGAVPEHLTIRTLGRAPEDILKMIKADETILEGFQHRRFYTWESNAWEMVAPIEKDYPVNLDPFIKSEIDRKVDFFKNHKDWFEKRGINHKLLIILEGPPGTGKSRLARYIADRLGWSLGTMLKEGGLVKAVRAAAQQDIVVSIPDIDAVGIGKARAHLEGESHYQRKKKKEEEQKASVPAPVPRAGLLSVADGVLVNSPVKDEEEDKKSQKQTHYYDDQLLAEALNLFQGDLPLNNSVVVASTNCVQELDKALLRPSRCDLVLYVGELKFEQFNEFFMYYYETQDPLPEHFKDYTFRACDLMEAFTENAFDKEGFIKCLEDKA